MIQQSLSEASREGSVKVDGWIVASAMCFRSALDAVLHKVHGGADDVHQRRRLNQDAHAVLLHQLVKFALVVCRTFTACSTGMRASSEVAEHLRWTPTLTRCSTEVKLTVAPVMFQVHLLCRASAGTPFTKHAAHRHIGAKHTCSALKCHTQKSYCSNTQLTCVVERV